MYGAVMVSCIFLGLENFIEKQQIESSTHFIKPLDQKVSGSGYYINYIEHFISFILPEFFFSPYHFSSFADNPFIPHSHPVHVDNSFF